MTILLEKAFKKASQLPKVEQNVFAKWILEELKAEKKWEGMFTDSEDLLDKLADEALADDRQGKTKSLNISKL